MLTAVGDADQTIYGFRGTRPDVLSRVTTIFDCVPLVMLRTCQAAYRPSVRCVAEVILLGSRAACRSQGPIRVMTAHLSS